MRRMMAVMLLLGFSALSTCAQDSLWENRNQALQNQRFFNGSRFPFPTDGPPPPPEPTPSPAGTVSVSELAVPDKAAKELERSDKALRAGDIRTSAEHLEKALAIYPNMPRQRNELGARYSALKEYDKAVEQFEKALALKPDYRLAADNIAAVLCFQHRYAEAEPAARRALLIDPQSPSSQYLLGSVLVEEAKNTDEAKQLLEKVKHKYSRARLFLAATEANRGEFDQAVEELRQYLQSSSQEYREVAQAWLDLVARLQQQAARKTNDPYPDGIDEQLP